jgi:hypothetical protein
MALLCLRVCACVCASAARRNRRTCKNNAKKQRESLLGSQSGQDARQQRYTSLRSHSMRQGGETKATNRDDPLTTERERERLVEQQVQTKQTAENEMKGKRQNEKHNLLRKSKGKRNERAIESPEVRKETRKKICAAPEMSHVSHERVGRAEILGAEQ